MDKTDIDISDNVVEQKVAEHHCSSDSDMSSYLRVNPLK